MQANALGYLRRYADPRAEEALAAALKADDPLLRRPPRRASRLPRPAGPVAGAGRRTAAVRLSALVSIVNGAVRPASARTATDYPRQR